MIMFLIVIWRDSQTSFYQRNWPFAIVLLIATTLSENYAGSINQTNCRAECIKFNFENPTDIWKTSWNYNKPPSYYLDTTIDEIDCMGCFERRENVIPSVSLAVSPDPLSSEYKLKLQNYRKCMRNYGVSNWKVVDSTSNITNYNILNKKWNKLFPVVFPVAIFLPSSVSDVQSTVKCGFVVKIQLVPKSGGHSFADLSAGTNDSILVDFRNMKSIEINQKEGAVTVGPGTAVAAVSVHIWRNGGWGIPHGICMNVGVGGHAVGGGMGFFGALYGLLLDNILEIKLVDARGNVLTVNSKVNPDLWWAMRGVGPGYIGLVTSLKIKMFKALDIKLTSVRIRYKVKDFAKLMGSFFKWTHWLKQNEPSVSTIVTAANAPDPNGIDVRLLHIQDAQLQPHSNATFLAALPKFFAKATETIINYPSYIEFVVVTSYLRAVVAPSQSKPSYSEIPSTSEKRQALAFEETLTFMLSLTKEIETPAYNFMRSFFIKKPFRARDWKKAQEVLFKFPSRFNKIMLSSEQGAVSVPKITDTSYVHRDCIGDFLIQFRSVEAEDSAAGISFVENMREATQFMDSGAVYQNHPEIDMEDHLIRFYGINLEKLIKIKRKFDPKGYFNATMSIPINRTWKKSD